MDVIINFIKINYNSLVMMLFLISSAFLIYSDSKTYQTAELKRERRFVLCVGYAYILIGLSLTVFVKLIG